MHMPLISVSESNRITPEQTLLLAKCVVVALLGDDDVLPAKKKLGHSGLLYLFASVLLCSFGVVAQSYAVQKILSGKYMACSLHL